jgi:uncharacterized protein YndB with AHSA1/START domain
VDEVEAEVVVDVEPGRAFELFTSGVDKWWRRGEKYGGVGVLGHRFDPYVGGEFTQILEDREAPLGHITVWEPPSRLVFTWRQGNWRPDEATEVEVTFAGTGDGATRVVLRHRGFDRITSDIGCDVGYRAGWAELLSWFGEATQ